jgi:hypothetical protein
MSNKPIIMLVHGAWADGSCWSKVILLLQVKGYNVMMFKNVGHRAQTTQRMRLSATPEGKLISVMHD